MFVARHRVRFGIGSLSQKGLRCCVAGRDHYVPSADPVIEADEGYVEPLFVLYEVSRWRP
jgi:hypothetical protein